MIAVFSHLGLIRSHTISKEISQSKRSDVAKFLAKTRAIRTVTSRQPRIIFALDATASREATWEQARLLHGELFAAADTISLAVQLCFYRGLTEFETSPWSTQSAALLDQMSSVHCLAGPTQINRVLSHALDVSTPINPIRAVIFVGDSCEEAPEPLFTLAGQCSMRNVPVFVFQEGQDPQARAIFSRLANLSGGAYAPFDTESADQLRELLGAVSRFAGGGRKALQRSNTKSDRILLNQLK